MFNFQKIKSDLDQIRTTICALPKWFKALLWIQVLLQIPTSIIKYADLVYSGIYIKAICRIIHLPDVANDLFTESEISYLENHIYFEYLWVTFFILSGVVGCIVLITLSRSKPKNKDSVADHPVLKCESE